MRGDPAQRRSGGCHPSRFASRPVVGRGRSDREVAPRRAATGRRVVPTPKLTAGREASRPDTVRLRRPAGPSRGCPSFGPFSWTSKKRGSRAGQGAKTVPSPAAGVRNMTTNRYARGRLAAKCRKRQFVDFIHDGLSASGASANKPGRLRRHAGPSRGCPSFGPFSWTGKKRGSHARHGDRFVPLPAAGVRNTAPVVSWLVAEAM